MNKDDVIRLARVWLTEFGIKELERGADVEINVEELASFAKLVAEHEREQCAKVCEEQQKRSAEASEKAKRATDGKIYHHASVTAAWNAAAIRARGSE